MHACTLTFTVFAWINWLECVCGYLCVSVCVLFEMHAPPKQFIASFKERFFCVPFAFTMIFVVGKAAWIFLAQSTITDVQTTGLLLYKHFSIFNVIPNILIWTHFYVYFWFNVPIISEPICSTHSVHISCDRRLEYHYSKSIQFHEIGFPFLSTFWLYFLIRCDLPLNWVGEKYLPHMCFEKSASDGHMSTFRACYSGHVTCHALFCSTTRGFWKNFWESNIIFIWTFSFNSNSFNTYLFCLFFVLLLSYVSTPNT